ncbi:hypothetical protein QVG61_02055 [Thiohalobacter sp. IOR34]|uniref:hypothetical protein n=1 Tax=Thiohalobacter sp. IOR34 TaxID=3057176 RepID=UPI0025B0464B|nr:hypothetical protein [Thiohalobacter sp. IOR34]WJW75895.1 hypothetical protein QVG61_02055 [Thiohalobacter sp. IOR34]
MTIETLIDPATGLVTNTVSGIIGLPDIQAAWKETLQDPAFRPDMNVLWDFSLVEGIEPGSREMEKLAELTREHIARRGSGYRLALVAPRDFYFGLCRMFEAYADDLPIEVYVFRDRKDALQWLNPGPSPAPAG